MSPSGDNWHQAAPLPIAAADRNATNRRHAPTGGSARPESAPQPQAPAASGGGVAAAAASVPPPAAASFLLAAVLAAAAAFFSVLVMPPAHKRPVPFISLAERPG